MAHVSTLSSAFVLACGLGAAGVQAAVIKAGLDLGDVDNQVVSASGNPYEGYVFANLSPSSTPTIVDFFNSDSDTGVSVTQNGRTLTFDGSRTGGSTLMGTMRDYTGIVGAGSTRDDKNDYNASTNPLRDLVGDAVAQGSNGQYARITIKGLEVGETVSMWLYFWKGGNTAATTADLQLDLNNDGNFDAPIQVAMNVGPSATLSPSLVSGATGIGYEGSGATATGLVQVKFVAESTEATFGFKKNGSVTNTSPYLAGMTVEATGIPEPTGVALVTGAALFGLSRRRRRAAR